MTLVAKHNQNQRLHTFIHSSTPCNTCLILKYSAAMSFLPCDKSAGLAEYGIFSICVSVTAIYFLLHSSWFGLMGHYFPLIAFFMVWSYWTSFYSQLILGKQVTADENFIAKVADAGIRNFFWGKLMMHARLH
ncbi:hypothetical protein ACOSQ3_024308 [Xanthoceras sorbifolium]